MAVMVMAPKKHSFLPHVLMCACSSYRNGKRVLTQVRKLKQRVWLLDAVVRLVP